MQRFLRKAAANTNASSHFSVGADAYIGPGGSCEFAENLRENGAFCRADVGIGPYKQVGSCGTNSHWAFASCNCLLRTSQSASLTAPLSGEPGALPRQVHAREKLQLHQPSAAVGADGVVHVVQIAAVGAGDLLDTARFRRFGIAEQIKFELFAALTAFDVHIQRTR